MTEEWREIKDHSGYEVSDQGRVRSYRTAQGHPSSVPRLLSPGNVRGYQQIKLGRSTQLKVHTLVLAMFIGPCPEGMEARHLNSDPSDNRLTNLAWGTKPENYADRHGNGTDNTGSRNGRTRLTEDQVKEIFSHAVIGRPYTEIMKEFGVSRSIVTSIRCGRSWRHVTGLPEYYARTREGSANGRARLNEDQVREIRRRLIEGARQKDLAEEYRVSPQTLSLIKLNKIWKGIE